MKKKTKKSKPKARAKVNVKRKPKKASRPKTRSKAKAPTAKKKTKKKAASKSKTRKKTAEKSKMGIIPPVNSVLLGRVEDYYAHIGVIALTLKNPIKLGDHLHVLGHTTHLDQTLDSMQINHQSVTEAKAQDPVGIKITSRARRGDYVFLIRG